MSIGKPTKWTPDEYVMNSQWKNEESLREFAGENWSQAHIPEGMEKFLKECWIHHFELFENAWPGYFMKGSEFRGNGAK